ncbi:hypothetical protein H6B33_05555, partial [Gemmiger formicilis]|uniref:hypothetical protein n=1 Tax=Gemmiger formicilis TaxID=745368 RepID=UPI0019588C20
SIFEEAYQQGRVIDEQFYNDYKDLKDELRTRAVTLDTESRNAAEYADLRRSAMGRVRLTNEGGVPVDVRYMELSEHCRYFRFRQLDAGEWNPSDGRFVR